jgi:CheR methyltransferase, SAM binding domain
VTEAKYVERPGSQDLRQWIETPLLGVNERIWSRLPVPVRDLRSVRAYGGWLHAAVCRRANRQMYMGTQFHRNRPAQELMRRLADRSDPGSPFTITVLGCSIGVEVYSILSTLRSSRPGLEFAVQAVDISPEAVHVAEQGVYSQATSEMVHSRIFDGLTRVERTEMFDWDGDEATIKPWLRDGITWHVDDASDPSLPQRLGPQELVVANNFLCHMSPRAARPCLRNVGRLVTDGGYLFVTGVDLDVRTGVAIEQGWEPISELRGEIHDGDPLVRADWPWRWWGLEPLDQHRRDWETRYTAAFRVTTPHHART